jgi:hypothetical protein
VPNTKTLIPAKIETSTSSHSSFELAAFYKVESTAPPNEEFGGKRIYDYQQ